MALTNAERKRNYNRRQKIKKYGIDLADIDLRGKHGNQASGERNGRWNASERRPTSHGYIAVRVPVDHPHGWGPSRLKNFKYAYEHIVVMMAHIGRSLANGEVVHHKNGNRSDNRIENLELTTAAEHQRHHANETRGRDGLGRFTGDMAEWPEDLRTRGFPV